MTTTFWRTHQLLLDPWGGEHELPVQLGAADADALEHVEVDLEPVDWVPLHPDPDQPLPDRLAFIDGRRRLDARLVGRHDGAPLYGAFATLGVGAVLVDRHARKATYMPPRIRRLTALGAQVRADAVAIVCPFGGKQVLDYEASLTGPDNGPDIPMMLVQAEMLKEEGRLAKALAGTDVTVIRDGPLRGDDPTGTVLGYVKTMHRNYLPDEHGQILWQLPAGSRTPLFRIGTAGTTDYRWSWYLRSAHPDRSHGLFGVVRLELSANVPMDKARLIADQTCALIPFYASQPHRDPRAPQNLTPVGALEKEIGRHMGDPRVVMRRLSHFLALQRN